MCFVATPQHVQTLFYCGVTFSPESAVERGLVDTVVAPEHLFEHAMHVAETLAMLPSVVFTLTRRQLRAPLWQRVRD
jgi:enoyl-CoA hydratase/carnithine racemase